MVFHEKLAGSAFYSGSHRVFFFEVALVFPYTDVLLSISHFISKTNHRILKKGCTETSRINTIGNFYSFIKGIQVKVYFLCVLCCSEEFSDCCIVWVIVLIHAQAPAVLYTIAFARQC